MPLTKLSFRNIFLLFFLISISFKGNSQLLSYGGGINLSNGTTIHIEKYNQEYYSGSLGLHAKATYKLDYHLRLVPKLAVYLPKTKSLQGGESKTMVTDLNVNIYNIHNPRDMIRTYLFGGVNFSGWRVQDDSESPERSIDLNKYGLYPGVSGGAGFKFNIQHDMELFIEGKYIKYLTAKSSQIMGHIGVNMILD